MTKTQIKEILNFALQILHFLNSSIVRKFFCFHVELRNKSLVWNQILELYDKSKEKKTKKNHIHHSEM